MKRGVAILLVFAVLGGCGCVCSCSGGGNVGGALEAVCEELGSENAKAVFCSDRTRSSEKLDFSVLDGKELGFIYYGKYEVPACFDKVVDVAVRLPLDTSGFELHIIECADVSGAEEAAKMLRSRVDRLQGAEILEFAPEGYEICFRGATVITFSRYACLLATPDNSAAERVVRRILG